MFNVNPTRPAGFHMTFSNGWTASVQWSTFNYCDNYDLAAGSTPSSSTTAEIAAWDTSNGDWYSFGDDDVKGYCTPEEVTAFLFKVSLF